MNLLTKLNVIEQVYNIGLHECIQKIWSKNHNVLKIFGLIYDTERGKLHDIGMNVDSKKSLDYVYQKKIKFYTRKL